MDEWFKARLIWREGIEALSDAEAGRLAKALWRYAATGEAENLSGGEKFAFAVCMATLRQDTENRSKVSAERSEAGKKGGRPKKANESKKSNCFSEKAKKANESKKSNKEIRNKNNIPPYNPPMGEDDDEEALLALSARHQEVYDKAERCGFKPTTANLDALTGLIADHGADSVLAALDECVESNAINFRYLRAVLKGEKRGKEPEQPTYQRLFQ